MCLPWQTIIGNFILLFCFISKFKVLEIFQKQAPDQDNISTVLGHNRNYSHEHNLFPSQATHFNRAKKT